MKTARLCHKCDKPVSSQSVTGYCRACYARMLVNDPHHQKKMAAGLRIRFETDPEFRARSAEQTRRNCQTPTARLARQACARALLADPEIRAKNIAAIRATKMRHIPEPMWSEYYHLTRQKRMPRAEATAIVLDEYRRIDPVAAAAFEGRNVVPIKPRLEGWRKLVADVAAAFGTNADEVFHGPQYSNIVDARAVVALVLHDQGVTFAEIGRRLCQFDHTIARYYIRSFAARCKKRPAVATVYAQFSSKRRAA